MRKAAKVKGRGKKRGMKDKANQSGVTYTNVHGGFVERVLVHTCVVWKGKFVLNV